MEKCDEDDVDYMSEDFLKELEDVRPGLLSRESKRKSKVEKKSTELPKSKKRKVVEDEAREKGLSLPISSDNKGFALLQKMGYKQGTSLGRSGDGKTSLIPLVVKDGKSGLGRRNFDMERKVEGKVQDAKKFTDFRQRKQASLLKTRIISDLRKSKLACHQLDSACGCTSPAVDWYWPEEFVPKEEEEEEEEEEESDSDEDELLEIEPLEQLENITAYLRANHFYCIWCGTAYKDDDDMKLNCPGDDEGAHE